MARALDASRRAIELDPDDPFALTVAGHVLAFIGRKPGEAIELFNKRWRSTRTRRSPGR